MSEKIKVLIPVQATLLIPIEVDGEVARKGLEKAYGAHIVNATEEKNTELFKAVCIEVAASEAINEAVHALNAAIGYYREYHDAGVQGYVTPFAGVAKEIEV